MHYYDVSIADDGIRGRAFDSVTNTIGDTERRVYGDEIILNIAHDGTVIPEPTSAIRLGTTLLLLSRRRYNQSQRSKAKASSTQQTSATQLDPLSIMQSL
ncbi:MAG: hypothetical protein AB8C95_08235 [Phycisphaeraceae bacterium]